MRASRKSVPVPSIATADELIEFTGLDVTARWIRQLASEGRIKKVGNNTYDLKQSVQALIAYYRNIQGEHADKKKAIDDEKHRTLKRENDIADELLVKKLDVVTEYRKVAEPIHSMLTQKLENEYPLAVAGLDVPQARIYGRRLNDDIRRELAKFYGRLGI